MDALRLTAGSRVADVGAGDGYFTWHLAKRVGPDGRVYAVDIQQRLIDDLTRESKKRDLPQVHPTLGDVADPHLPTGELDAVLVVNAYHEMDAHDAMLAKFAMSLKSGGRLAIIDKETKEDRERGSYHSIHAIPKSIVRAEAEKAGFRFAGEQKGFQRARDKTDWWFLLFEKP